MTPLLVTSEVYRGSSYGPKHPLAIPRVPAMLDLCAALGWLPEAQVIESPRATAAELARAADDLTEAEVARARAQLRASLLMGQESPSNRAERAARLLSIWGRVPEVDETAARIAAVTVADTRAFAARLLARPPALAVYGPAGAARGADALRARLVA